ncbi:MAG: hypothetical protein GY711_10380 [bacterium]|nr:hypothetical protein [bacterium]
MSPEGKVVYELRRPWRDGTTHFVFEPLTLLERLAALVLHPRPRRRRGRGAIRTPRIRRRRDRARRLGARPLSCAAGAGRRPTSTARQMHPDDCTGSRRRYASPGRYHGRY